jgi:uncharacterized protein with HEPN domain
MTQKDDTVYLREILDCIAQVEEYVHGVSYETFLRRANATGCIRALIGG